MLKKNLDLWLCLSLGCGCFYEWWELCLGLGFVEENNSDLFGFDFFQTNFPDFILFKHTWPRIKHTGPNELNTPGNIN